MNQTSPWLELRIQIYLGDEQFVGKSQAGLEQGEDLSEIPAAQRRKSAKSLDDRVQKRRNRNEAIVMAYQSGGYRLKAIGEHFGLHYSQ